MSYGDLEIKSNSKFLKIESGVPHDIRLLSESPESKVMHGFGKEATVCEENDQCLPCQEGHEARQRFSAQVYDFLLKRVLTWEFGSAVAKQLKAIDNTLQEESKKITQVDLKVEASGEKMQKKYMVTPRMTSKVLPPEVEIGF
jgi:hypothetical protein